MAFRAKAKPIEYVFNNAVQSVAFSPHRGLKRMVSPQNCAKVPPGNNNSQASCRFSASIAPSSAPR
ncbi:MAG TPA: hypothetical protein PK808_01935, partial [Polymorphobacter sp.]|nr:hypothetical protein [Polymorphobacter sp.]